METVFDVYTSADAANEVAGKLEFDGQMVYVKQIGDTFAVIIMWGV